MAEKSTEKKRATFENYAVTYTGFAADTRKETYQRYPLETDMLFEFVDNWPDFAKFFKERHLEFNNSLSGIILLSSWRLTNWITFDILGGKYFEAIRNLRFVFEGGVYAVLIEDVIEATVYERWKNLSSLDLKAEIFELWEQCRQRRVYARGKVNSEKVKRIVTDYVAMRIEASKKAMEQEYTGIYTEILCDERLYMTTNRMIQQCARFLRLDDSQVEKLQSIWHELSRYQHFSYPYLKAVIDDPELIFLEKLNSDMLRRSVSLYFDTLDFFYSVLAWRFQFLRKQIKEMCDWWSKNFHRAFGSTEKTLASLA